MYVLVQHTISEPAVFWNAADPRSNLPPKLKLHHTFPTSDGTRAVCIWEAESVNAVRDYLEPMFGKVSRTQPPSLLASSSGIFPISATIRAE